MAETASLAALVGEPERLIVVGLALDMARDSSFMTGLPSTRRLHCDGAPS